MRWLQTGRNTQRFLVLGNAVAIISAMTSSSLFGTNPSAMASTTNPYNNVLLASSRLVPFAGSMTIAHQTRKKAMDLLQETMTRRNDDERAMIVDISATTWNWDTYAIVAGTPQPIKLIFINKQRLMEYLPLAMGKETESKAETAQRGILVPQQPSEDGAVPTMVWVPKGAILREVNKRDDGTEEFVLEAPIDPNDDRLEHWEQEVLGKQWIYKTRAKLASECMRNMMRFYDLDRIICWDLSWGVWEAVRDGDRDAGDSDDGYPCMTLLKDGKDKISFPSFDGTDDEDEDIKLFYDYSRPISPPLLAETLKSVSGYYLVGGNTYTMSLFHHMWDQQQDNVGETNGIGHMQLLRNLLADGTLFYLGHSAVSLVFLLFACSTSLSS